MITAIELINQNPTLSVLPESLKTQIIDTMRLYLSNNIDHNLGIKEKIIKLINDRMGVTLEEMRSLSRKREYVDARVVYSVVCRRAGMSFQAIANELNKVQHSSVIHYVKNIAQVPQTAKKVNELISCM